MSFILLLFSLPACSDGDYKYPRDHHILSRIPQETLERMSEIPDDYKTALAMRFDGVICEELRRDTNKAEKEKRGCSENYEEILSRSSLLISMGYQLREGPIPKKYTNFNDINNLNFPIESLSCQDTVKQWQVCEQRNG